jgi:hypothetical protein
LSGSPVANNQLNRRSPVAELGTGVDSRLYMAKARKRQDANAPPASSSQTGSATLDRPADAPTNSDDPRANGEDRRDRIARHAYQLYLARGGAHGSDWEDWLAAEREVFGPNEDEPTE